MREAIRPSRRRPTSKRRAAITLVEVLGTLSLLLILGVSAAKLLDGVTEIGARAAHRKQMRASVLRLAETFRLDVQSARNLKFNDDHWPIEMTTAGATIRYDWDRQAHAIQRSADNGQKRVGVEQFRLSDQCEPSVAVSGELVTLVLTEGERKHPWIIEAFRS